jgi:hypothetical protein
MTMACSRLCARGTATAQPPKWQAEPRASRLSRSSIAWFSKTLTSAESIKSRPLVSLLIELLCAFGPREAWVELVVAFWQQWMAVDRTVWLRLFPAVPCLLAEA